MMKLNLGMSYMWSAVTKITTPDEYTLAITTKYPVDMRRVASAQYASYMVSPKAAGQTEEWWNAPHEAGTGPYKLVSYMPNGETVFERNQDYWGGWKTGQFYWVVCTFAGDAATQRQMIEAGEVDYASVDYDSLPAMQANKDITVLVNDSVWNVQLLLNTEREPLNDVRVRQAISYAMPYDD